MAKWLTTALLAVAFGVGVSANAADVPAGTQISNTAQVNYLSSGQPYTQTASAVFKVDQLVNVTVTWQNATDVSVLPGGTNQTLLFRITNTGNGSDTFALGDSLVTPGGTTFAPAGCLIYFDTANTGIFSPTDQLYTPGSNDPTLAQNAAVNMLVVCNVPNNAVDTSLGEMQLAATSKTANGPVGTVKTGGGVGGIDAIVGLTGGVNNSTGLYQVHDVLLTYTKSQTVTDPTGGTLPVPGALIQYTLTVVPSGSATASNVVVTDAVPANTSFVAGSILLNGAAVGAGVGDYNVTTPGAVTVKLGNVPGGASAQVVKFQVQIN
jgi:uncharacterized repeat protein (TIGR01451 family)